MDLEKPNSAEKFIGTMAERLGAAARASTIFGDPVERDGITVIPVARARWGFGGGVGSKKDEDGAGGGGGVQVTPVGFIELKNGEARVSAHQDYFASLGDCGRSRNSFPRAACFRGSTR